MRDRGARLGRLRPGVRSALGAGVCGVVLAIATTTLGAPADVVGECADADGDGVFTVADVVHVLRAAAGLPDSCTPFRCDVDGNDAVTVSDGVMVMQRMAGLTFVNAFACPIPARVHDFSGFGTLRVSLQPTPRGFCARPGSVVSGTIERQGDGSDRVRLAIAEERSFDDPACHSLPTSEAGTCIVSVPRVDRLLSADEAVRIRAAVRAVTIHEAPSALCVIGAFESCLRVAVAWDDLTVRDDGCAAPWLSPLDALGLASALDGMVVPAPRP